MSDVQENYQQLSCKVDKLENVRKRIDIEADIKLY